MGKGDIKSRRGKLFAGSFGKKRPAKKARKAALKIKPVPVEKPAAKAPSRAPKTLIEEADKPQKKIEVQEKVSKAIETPLKEEKTAETPPKKSTPQEKPSKPVIDSPTEEKTSDTESKENN
ncbi:MAG: 30S ribosomal protein THX [Bacteroidales bacterium]|nr:30S ribosomal protein THX [Bacteroidales bacterium]